MGKEHRSVKYLADRIRDGEILLPEMQRDYVWTTAKVCNLLDSLYRNYPSGTILAWETPKEFITRAFAISQKKSHRPTQLLLDGQQRLTSLSAIMRGETLTVRGREKKVDIMFNLKHSDKPSDKDYDNDDDGGDDGGDASEVEKQKQLEKMTFMVKSSHLKKLPHWVSVTKALQSSDNIDFLLDEGAVSDMSDPNVKPYNKRLTQLRKIQDYEYDVHVLESHQSYEEVTEIFVRVNSLGAKLTGSDLALAQITAKWQGSLIIFEEFKTECKDNNFDLNLSIIVRNLIAFAKGASNSKTLSSLKQDELKKAWTDSKKGFKHAIDFLKNNLAIDSPALLSSPYIIIALAYFFHHQPRKLSREDEAKLRSWLLIANAKGHYSRGSIYSFLDQDLKDIREGKGLDTMIDSLESHFGLYIEESELKDKNSRSAYFKTMFLAFQADGAKDWETRVAISFNNINASNKLQFHHIFPQSKLKGKYTSQEINDICNLAFIGGKTNLDISDEFPSVYLPEISKDLLETQQVPTKETLWEMDKYADFLKKRRKMVADRLNEFIKLPKKSGNKKS